MVFVGVVTYGTFFFLARGSLVSDWLPKFVEFLFLLL
jgi:hypothetical protein